MQHQLLELEVVVLSDPVVDELGRVLLQRLRELQLRALLEPPYANYLKMLFLGFTFFDSWQKSDWYDVVVWFFRNISSALQ